MHEMIAERVKNDCQLAKLYDEVWSRPAVSAVGRVRNDKGKESRAQTSPGSWQQRRVNDPKNDHQTSQQSQHETGMDASTFERKTMQNINDGTFFNVLRFKFETPKIFHTR